MHIHDDRIDISGDDPDEKNGLVLQSIDYPLISLYKVDLIVIATVSLSEFIAL